MAKMTGGRAAVRSLINNGVDTVFGLPGVQMDAFFNALHDEANHVKVINARHEQGVAYMANGYAQATGKTGVYAVVPGPGLLNTTAALSSAYAVGAPVLAVAAEISSFAIGEKLGMLHEINNQSEVLRGLTKWTGRAMHQSHIPGLIDEAFRQMQSGYVRPTAVEIPWDVLAEEADVRLLDAATANEAEPVDPDLIDAAAKILGAAKKPMIVVGGGAMAAGEEVKALAEALQAPVVSNRTARGLLSDHHPLSVTSVVGFELWPDVDAVLAIGTRLQAPRNNWGMHKDRKIVMIDIDPDAMFRTARSDVGIVGDARVGAHDLLAALGKYNSDRPSRAEEIQGVKAATLSAIENKLGPQVAYQKVLRNALDEEDILVDELTQVGYLTRAVFPVYGPNTLISTGYQGTLGAGFATSIGAKVGQPDKRVLSINGDGGFLYTAAELATAVLHNIPIVAIVFADGYYGNVRRMQEELWDNRVIATELKNPDFVKMAESFGAVGMRAEGPENLAKTLEEAFAMNGPVLIEVPMPKVPDPWPVIVPRR